MVKMTIIHRHEITDDDHHPTSWDHWSSSFSWSSLIIIIIIIVIIIVVMMMMMISSLVSHCQPSTDDDDHHHEIIDGQDDHHPSPWNHWWWSSSHIMRSFVIIIFMIIPHHYHHHHHHHHHRDDDDGDDDVIISQPLPAKRCQSSTASQPALTWHWAGRRFYSNLICGIVVHLLVDREKPRTTPPFTASSPHAALPRQNPGRSAAQSPRATSSPD
jgi:uncharacterized membrane protein